MKTKNECCQLLLDYLSTKQDQELLLSELNQLQEQQFSNISSQFSGVITKLWDKFQQESPQGKLNEFIDKVKTALTNFKLVTLTIAYSPSYKQAVELTSWLRGKLKNNLILLDTQFDSQIVAGCIYEYDGERIDLSLNNKIDLYVQNQ